MEVEKSYDEYAIRNGAPKFHEMPIDMQLMLKRMYDAGHEEGRLLGKEVHERINNLLELHKEEIIRQLKDHLQGE